MTAAARQVNYDSIAPTYARRYEASPLSGVEQAVLSLAREIPARRVLEVGCGTGRWLGSLSKVGFQVFGLDLSTGMLNQAGKHLHGAHLACGRAGGLPFQEQRFDLVFVVNAIHHFSDPRGFIAQAWTLLRPGGALAIVGQVPQERHNRWYVYDYFEDTYQTDIRRFQTWETLRAWIQAEGYQNLLLKSVEHISDPKYGAEVLEDPFLQKTAISQLALLSDQAYQRGLQRIRDALEEARSAGKDLVFPVELRLDMLAGFRDPLAPSA